MARIPYASPEHYQELMHNVRLPDDAARTNAFGMLAHAPAIGGSVLKLIHTILTAADLDFFLHELVILRVTQRCHAHYAWIQHVAIAQAIGMTSAQVEALEQGDAPAELFSSRERAVLAFTDEVLDKPRVSDHTFERVRQEFSTREVVELLVTIGYFRMIAGLITTLDIEPDPPRAIELLELSARQHNWFKKDSDSSLNKPLTHRKGFEGEPTVGVTKITGSLGLLHCSFTPLPAVLQRTERILRSCEVEESCEQSLLRKIPLTVIECGDRCRIQG